MLIMFPLFLNTGKGLYFPMLDPGKNLHADPDPEPGGIRGVKGKIRLKKD